MLSYGQTNATLLDVTCCVRNCKPFCVLLRVVAQSLNPVKPLATCKRTQKLPTMSGVVGQQFCVRLHEALHL